MTLAIIITLIIFSFTLQISLSQVLKKVVNKKTYIWFVVLLVLDGFFSLSFLLSVHLEFPFIYQKIFKYATLVSIATYFVTYMEVLKDKRRKRIATAFISYVVSMFIVVFLGEAIGIIASNIIIVAIIVLWCLLTYTRRKYSSVQLTTLVILLVGTELLRYIIESVITYELLYKSIENLWLVSLTFLIKTISVLIVIEIKNNISINKNLAKVLDFHSSITFLDLILKEDPNAIVLTDINQRIVYVNAHLLTITGYAESEVIGQRPKIFASGKTNKAVYEDMYEKLREFKSWKGEFINKKKSGEIFIEESKVVTLFDVRKKPMFFLAIKTDVTKEKTYLKKLEQHSKHDDLTGLYRRNYFLELMKEKILEKNAEKHYFILIDLDKFKFINDTYGHRIGDKALTYFAKKLKEIFSVNAAICRFGGDEFAIHVYGYNNEELEMLINRFYEVLKTNYLVEENKNITLQASAGYVLIDLPFNFKRTYEIADKMLYKCKDKNKF